jgi:hypothetical protein
LKNHLPRITQIARTGKNLHFGTASNSNRCRHGMGYLRISRLTGNQHECVKKQHDNVSVGGISTLTIKELAVQSLAETNED